MKGIDASIHGRRRPAFRVVLSLKYPASGSVTASQILERPKRKPITAGEISRTSVENFSSYRDTMKNMKPTPTVGML